MKKIVLLSFMFVFFLNFQGKTQTGGDMQIFVKTPSGKTITIDCSPSDLIDSVKSVIYKKENIPVNEQKLICNQKELKNGSTIGDNEIRKESNVYLFRKK